jgi:quinol monooxygenase YgiN
MATILAHIQTHAGREADFESLVAWLHGETHAREPGCRHYEYWRGQEPGFYYCLLAFDDFNAFVTHQASDHHEEASPKFGDLIREMKLEWVDPVGGASPLPPSDPQEVAEGATALKKRMARMFSVQSAAWWSEQRR